MMIAAIACICACEKTETPVETFETNMHKLYGEYRLSDIHWPGLPVNLNGDEHAYWDLLHEFKNKPGYYEQDYAATVGDGFIYSEDQSWAKYTAGFNVTLPYPKYDITDGKWACSEISMIKMTIRATEDTFKLSENCCWTYPGYTGSDDPFLSNIKNLSLFVMTFDENSFKIGVLCTLPHNDPNGPQTLAENYLYYTFTRK